MAQSPSSFSFRRIITLFLLPCLSTLFNAFPSRIIGRVDAFAPIPCRLGPRQASSSRSARIAKQQLDSTKYAEEGAVVVESIRAALYQSPAQSSKTNPLAVLTQMADTLRVASAHGVDVVLFPELFLGGGSPDGAMDRESYELNIVGNMCGELNVACLVGYSESIHENELKLMKDADDDDSVSGKGGAFNSIAAFHADGSRAGNYRSVASNNDASGQGFRKGHTFVEAIPTLLILPNKKTISGQVVEREVKVGMMCGNDALSPEHCRHLVRSGARAILAPASFRNNEYDLRMIECVIPTRAMENEVPFLYANPVQLQTDGNASELDFVGSSAIVSKDGSYLVCAPRGEGGDMPCDGGYLIPCDVGALYGADIDLVMNSPEAQAVGESLPSDVIRKVVQQWDLSPCMPGDRGELSNRHRGAEKREGNGFGRESRRKGAKAKK